MVEVVLMPEPNGTTHIRIATSTKKALHKFRKECVDIRKFSWHGPKYIPYSEAIDLLLYIAERHKKLATEHDRFDTLVRR